MSDMPDDKVAREIVQARLLSRIFARTLKGELALKGGMALRISTGTSRLTKDIDLMSPPGTNRVESHIKAAIADLKASGLMSGFVCTQPKNTDTTLRWKIGGRVGATMVNLTVEVSRRVPLPEGHVKTVSWAPPQHYGIAPMFIDCIDLPMLAATKLSCLLDDNREAPRDIFDLHLLVTLHVRPPVDVIRRFGQEHLEHGLRIMWDKLEKMDYKTVETELLPHLEPGLRSRMTPELWEEMRTTAGVAAEEWIKEALDPDKDITQTPPGRGSP
jgi:predicted nucleotidyltransferase component of viral defense system